MHKDNRTKFKKIIGIDFFAGIGGVTRGFQRAGIKVIAGIDNDPAVQKCYEANNKEAKLILSDITNTEENVKVVKKLLRGQRYSHLVFSACAPCQPFSLQNKNYKKDTQRDLLLSFVRVLEGLPRTRIPNFIFFENVGPMKKRGKRVLAQVKTKLERLGFTVLEPQVINAAVFGVPQNRKRLIFVGARLGKSKTERFSWDYFFRNYAEKQVSVREVIGSLPPISAGSQNTDDPLHVSRGLSEKNMLRLKSIKEPGGSRSSWPEDLILNCHKKYDGHTDVYGRMAWDQPSPTLTCKFISLSNGRFGHPEQDRAISLREGAILQTMGNYRFPRPFSKETIARQIGNAVPPGLAKKFGRFLVELTKSSSSSRKKQRQKNI